MKNILLLIAIVMFSLPEIYGQGFGYDSKTDISKGLYKVKSGDCYGIIDETGNVVVSIEFQDILFKDGKALLVKDDVLHGVVDTLGAVKLFESQYKVHPDFHYIYDGYIIVGHNGKWGFMTVSGEPLCVKTKMKGIFSLGKKHPTMFDEVFPFVDGYAAVCVKKSGWKHIDKDGKERFLLRDKKMKALFRSSVYKGECVIITEEGIRQYQENEQSQAVVKRVLSSSATDVNYTAETRFAGLTCKEGTLTLDSLMRAYKYESGGKSVVFIEKPRAVIVPKRMPTPPDTLSVKKDLKVELVYKYLQANEKGRAYTEVKLMNVSDERFEKLSVGLECAGAAREWDGTLEGNSEFRLSFNVPARFSSAFITREIKAEITYNNETVEYVFPVTIKRYNPVRSR